MKYLNIIIFFICLSTYGQVPANLWINDDNFETKINNKNKFGDDVSEVVVVEFYADFNKQNAFSDWKSIKGAKYYRIDVATSPSSKKKYRIRMAPTIIVFKDGIKQKVFKAGLDLVCPVDIKELQETIKETNTASRF